MSWRKLLAKGECILREAGIEDASLDAWYLLEHVSGMGRADYFMNREEQAPPEEQKQYLELLEQRSRHIPLQYLTGSRQFMGLDFLVGREVLIPRQDTELLVEKLLPLVHGKKVLDLCTGSGCIAISLSTLGTPLSVTASDISEAALRLAEENAERLGAGVTFIQSDMFREVDGKYDVIVSNPPYIATDVVGTLMPEVREHEPMMALDGGPDGLKFYRQIAEEAGEHLNPDGMVWVEIGHDQCGSVSRLFQEKGFGDVKCYKDLCGKDRVLSASGKGILLQ